MADLEANPMEEVLEEARLEREKISGELREATAKLEQSRGELQRLADQNKRVTNDIAKMDANLDSVPPASIKELYDSAQEAQRNLYIMRGQVDKLQADEANLRRYLTTLDELLPALEGAGVSGGGLGTDGADGDGDGQATVIRIIEAQEVERQRLANQMHDGPAQSLTNFILQAEICQRLFDRDPSRAREELTNLKSSASSTFQRVRDFIFDLRPMMLDDLGLVPTVRRYSEAFGEKGNVTSNLIVTGEERRLEPHREVIVFRAIQELLTNARDHSGATEVTIALDMGPEQIRGSVEDDGKGFNPAQIAGTETSSQSFGLSTLRQRVELIGGDVHIDSQSGQGSRVTISVPAGPRM